jgi:HSP20 family protein
MAGASTRWDPFAEITDVRKRFDRLFDELGSHSLGPWMPAVDVVRRDDAVILRADLPGVGPNDLKLEVEDGILTMSGEHVQEHADTREDGHYVRRERRVGGFTRSIALPPGVDAQSITATTQDGVVEVMIPLPHDATRQKVEITPTATSGESGTGASDLAAS